MIAPTRRPQRVVPAPWCPANTSGHHGRVADDCVRVWVIDDQSAFRRATAATLAAMNDFVMAGECASGESAVLEIAPSVADLVLMDIHMPGIGGIEAARQIRTSHPDVAVVLMSTYDVEDLPAAAGDCGAAGYLHKERLCPQLLRRIWHGCC